MSFQLQWLPDIPIPRRMMNTQVQFNDDQILLIGDGMQSQLTVNAIIPATMPILKPFKRY